jgi:hypothetical protein
MSNSSVIDCYGNNEVENIDYDDDDTDTKIKFSKIINMFCESLIDFSVYVRVPTENTTLIIQKKKIFGKDFALYVNNVEQFNALILEIVDLIKKIILSLNGLFVFKKLNNLVEFIEHLRNFLVYLLKEHVFDVLHVFSKSLAVDYKNNLRIIGKVKKVKTIIIKMFDISLDITSIFIPQVITAKGIVVLIDKKTSEILDKKLEINEKNNIKVNVIIKQLLDIQLRSEIILSLNIKHAFKYLITKESEHLLIIIQNLQTEYIDLLNTTLFLKNEIAVFKKKKKSVITNILTILGK